MNKLALAILFTALPAAALAQDLPVSLAADPGFRELTMPWGSGAALVRGPLGRHATGSIALYGRASFPGDSDVTLDGVTWADLFDPGLGISLEADISTVVAKDWAVGGYVSVGWDSFSGITDTDDLGDSVHPNAMRMFSVIAGAKSTGWFDELFFWEGRIGLGLVHYSTVKADFDIGGTVFTDQEFFKASDRVVFEMGGRVGIGTPSVAFDFGLGFRIMGPPARGKDVTTFVDPETLVTFMLELGVMLRF